MRSQEWYSSVQDQVGRSSARPLKLFGYIRQQQHIRSEIEIVLVSHVLAFSGCPCVFCVGIVFVGGVFFVQCVVDVVFGVAQSSMYS